MLALRSDRLRAPSARTRIGLRLVLSTIGDHTPASFGREMHRPPVLRTGSALFLGVRPPPRSRAAKRGGRNLLLTPQGGGRGPRLGESTSRSPIRVRAEGARQRSL